MVCAPSCVLFSGHESPLMPDCWLLFSGSLCCSAPSVLFLGSMFCWHCFLASVAPSSCYLPGTERGDFPCWSVFFCPCSPVLFLSCSSSVFWVLSSIVLHRLMHATRLSICLHIRLGFSQLSVELPSFPCLFVAVSSYLDCGCPSRGCSPYSSSIV